MSTTVRTPLQPLEHAPHLFTPELMQMQGYQTLWLSVLHRFGTPLWQMSLQGLGEKGFSEILMLGMS